MSDNVATHSENPPASETPVEPVRGGWFNALLGTAERLLVRAAETGSEVADRSKEFRGIDPTRPIKKAMGWTVVGISTTEGVAALKEGEYSEAAGHLAVAGLVAVGSTSALLDPVVRAVNNNSITGHVARGAAWASDNHLSIAVKGGSTKIPLVGPILTVVHGAVAAEGRASKGDDVGATGELVVTGTTAGVMVAGIAGGSLACGPGAPLCAAVAGTVTFIASEGATEIAARSYNEANGTNIRGSTVGELSGYLTGKIEHGVSQFMVGQMSAMYGTAYHGGNENSRIPYQSVPTAEALTASPNPLPLAAFSARIIEK